jgi:hypothetical protein
MTENGDRFQTGMRLWLTQNWLILLLLVGGTGWAAGIQAEKADKAEVEARIDQVHLSIQSMAADIAYIKGVLDAQNQAGGQTP